MKNLEFKSKLPMIIWVTAFSIAMGFLETAVVVYLREICYPGGFNFPLQPIAPHLAITEVLREAATLVMLLGIGYMAGKSFTERFAYFIFSFAIWDIFYYVFLKLLLNWPESLMTWDILFLIPVTWTGPVLSPVIISCIMILLAMILIGFRNGEFYARINRQHWFIMLSGAFVVFLAFIWDYCRFMLTNFSISEIWSFRADKKALFDFSMKYIPVSFPWWLFTLGAVGLLWSIWLIYKRNKNEK
jgi:hypothetical protein